MPTNKGADILAGSQLYWSANSPYVRKVIVAAEEIGVGDCIECISAGDFILTGVGPSPITKSISFDKFNPSAKLPTLVLKDGRSFFGSQAIVQYFDFATGGGVLFLGGEDRFIDLMLESVADGILDAALQMRYETTLRPESMRWKAWLEGWQSKIERSLAALSPTNGHYDLPNPSARIGVGGIAVASALWYLSTRFPAIAWRKDAALSNWADAVYARSTWIRADAMGPVEKSTAASVKWINGKQLKFSETSTNAHGATTSITA